MLDKLTEKYWKGEISEEEFHQLKESLQQEELKAEQQALKEYLSFMEISRKENRLDVAFDKEILHKISKSKKRELFPLNWRNMAAAFILLCGFGYGINWSLNQTTTPVQTSVEKKTLEGNLAFNEVRKALMMLSTNLNAGLEHSRVLGEFHKAKEELELNKDQKNEGN